MTEISIGKLLYAKVTTETEDYVEYIEGNDTLENREKVVELLYDQILEDNYWAFSNELIDNGNGEYEVLFEDADIQNRYVVKFTEEDIPSPIRNINGVEVNMSEIHIPSDGSVCEWHLFEDDMDRQMLPKDVKKIIRHEMLANLNSERESEVK